MGVIVVLLLPIVISTTGSRNTFSINSSTKTSSSNISYSSTSNISRKIAVVESFKGAILRE